MKLKIKLRSYEVVYLVANSFSLHLCKISCILKSPNTSSDNYFYFYGIAHLKYIAKS